MTPFLFCHTIAPKHDYSENVLQMKSIFEFVNVLRIVSVTLTIVTSNMMMHFCLVSNAYCGY